MIIKRLLPPAVNLTRKRIGVLSEAQGGVAPDVATVLKTRVITAIQRDPNFIVDEAKPETRLSFKVTAFRVESVRVTNNNVNPPQTCSVYVGRADVSYQAIEVDTGVPQDSENLGWSITTDKPAGPVNQGAAAGLSKISEKLSFWKQPANCGAHGRASESEATDELYGQLVQQVTQRAAPVDEDVEVALPGGKLNQLSALALDKRWSVLLEQAEQMPKLPKPDEDASRLYLIALAHEALAYDSRRESFELERRRVSGVASDNSPEARAKEAKFFREAKNHLEQAAQLYRDAIGGDRDQKEFRMPEGRIEYAVRLYATIERQRAEYEAGRKKIAEEQTRRAAAPPPAKATDEANRSRQQSPVALKPSAAAQEVSGPNAEVIKLCLEKLDEATILDFIKESPPEFDLTAAGLVSLRRSCGEPTGKYIAAMRARMAAKAKPARPAAKPKPVAAPK